MFSVVIPLYNKELSIQNTIKSVLQQSFQEFEIVVVNDGSTDASVARVEEIDDSRIRVVHQKNQGVSAARNKGVAEAKFSWIAFLDGDDLWKTNHLQEVNEMIQLYPQEKVFATSFEYSDNRPMFRHPRDSKIVKVDDYFKDALKESMMWTSVVVVAKEAFNQAGKFDVCLSHGEDLDLWERLTHANSLIKSSEITAIYRVDAENRNRDSFDVNKSRAYNYCFTRSKSSSEKRYYRKKITNELRAFLKRKNIYLFFKLYAKHWKNVSILEVLKLKKL